MHKHPQQGKFVLVSLVLGSLCISSGSRTYPYIESSPRILLSDVGRVSEEVRLKHNRVSSCSSPLFSAHNSPFMSTYSCVESSPVISLSDVGRSLGCCSYQTWFKRDTECREIHLTSW